MKLVLIFLLALSSLYAQVNFNDYFVSKTLRMDYYHSGNDKEQSFTFSRLLEEPYWGGSKVNLVDTLNFGNFLVKVIDVKTNTLIYSRGFSSLFQARNLRT